MDAVYCCDHLLLEEEAGWFACVVFCLFALPGGVICRLSSRKHAYIVLTPLNSTLYSKTGVYMGIH